MNAISLTRSVLPLVCLVGLNAPGAAHATASDPSGLAIRCAKLITCAADEAQPQVIDQALILVRDGKIQGLGRADELEIPAGFDLLDRRDAWVVPGMLDLHSHMGHDGLLADWNASVWLVNPGLRVSSAVEPGNFYLQRAVAGGVTGVLFIPGSGTNMSGAGVLLKTAATNYEDALIQDPGSLKIAQAGNPERWAVGVGRTFMNWTIRNVLARGTAYAKAWEAFEAGTGDEPAFDPKFEIVRSLRDGDVAVSAHTQMYQVVLMTLTMISMDFGFKLFIDHGTFDGWRAAEIAETLGVQAILGPRTVSTHMVYPGFVSNDTDGRFDGVAAKYQAAGHTAIGFNTDAINPNFNPNGPWTEELSLQAAMGVRYGLSNEKLEALRGLTIVAAQSVDIDDRVGSIEVGKDADLVIVDGDPTDPRMRVDSVFIDGALVYDRRNDPERW